MPSALTRLRAALNAALVSTVIITALAGPLFTPLAAQAAEAGKPAAGAANAAANAAAYASTTTPRAQPGAAAQAAPRLKLKALPNGWHHGAFMEIFVRAYQDSDGDGIGDLRGLTSRLDYLQALGVKGLWLMPITRSADGDHGYATTDFRAIEPAYGTLADFDELLRQAHQRGIGVIMDYVINHAAATHPFFVDALKGASSPYRNWFLWSDEAPLGWDIWGQNPWYHAGQQPWAFKGELKDLPVPKPGARDFYFATFGPHMPDFNFRNPAVFNYHAEALRFWLDRGLDGYRLDAVPHLVENNPRDWNDQLESRRVTKRLQDLIKRYPKRYVVCEATAKPQDYGDPALCGGAFAFGYVHHYVEAARGKAESVQELARYFLTARPTMATFLSNHDRFAGQRLWDQLGGDSARYRLAAAAYLLQPGTPFIYYGEELGQGGATSLSGDAVLRSPMSWAAPGADALTRGFSSGTPFRPLAPNAHSHNAAQAQADPQSLLAFYKALLALRNSRPSISQGRFEQAFAQDQVLGFERRHGRERSLVLINFGEQVARVGVGAGRLPTGGQPRALFPADAVLPANWGPSATLELPALSVRVLDWR